MTKESQDSPPDSHANIYTHTHDSYDAGDGSRGSRTRFFSCADEIFPISGCNTITYIRPTLTRKNILAGDFSYFTGRDFEQHVTHHYEFNGDKLIIGKFCQIGEGVNFVMNGANHQLNAATTYPFFIFPGWNESAPPSSDMPLKGDTVIGNDVWIGQNVTILPGVHVDDGAIIGLNSTVTRDIPAYTVAAGDPARVIRKRFDDELIALLQKLCWWDKPVGEIKKLIPILTCPDLEKVRREIKIYLENEKEIMRIESS